MAGFLGSRCCESRARERGCTGSWVRVMTLQKAEHRCAIGGARCFSRSFALLYWYFCQVWPVHHWRSLGLCRIPVEP